MTVITKTIMLSSPETSRRFGIILGSLCLPGDIVALGGDLGAGKTTLVQAIAAGAGVDSEEYVCSPSFALLHEYRGRFPLYHMDFYRLESLEAVLAMGLDEYLYLAGISLVEWYDKAAGLFPEQALFIDLTVLDEFRRQAVLRGNDPSWQHRLDLLIERFSAATI